ncbi:Ldh family oxidoreductase [Leucobacter tenebrionis]|uniref:Ldh family oxidoreductase n=1 Tax=Leucobacter tenebrionis TaxID=2873270 RepID=UPI001CA66F86|nr:Ldh family oxidoreductase [Leucobacter tenebrionis]QZY52202.1 Ldh family oxidoreductase [Leucobacter tenebrionis]
MNAMVEVPADRLRQQIAAVLAPYAEAGAARGIAAEDADRAALWLVQAEQLGLGGFGLDMLLRDLTRLDSGGGLEPGLEEPAERSAAGVEPGAAVTSFDAAGVPGPLALAAAARISAGGASTHGIGLVGISGVGALGVLGLAARALAEEGNFALVSAQAPAMVAPWGGREPAIGTNPLAFGAPRDAAPPLVADFATSQLTLAELRLRRETGEALPAGTALDAAGAPTTDPAAAAALLPEGRLGSLAGLLVEVLAGAAVGGRTPRGDAAAGRGAVVLALDPMRAGGGRIAETVAEIASDWRAAGGHVPGRFDALSTPEAPPAISVERGRYSALVNLGAASAASSPTQHEEEA